MEQGIKSEEVIAKWSPLTEQPVVDGFGSKIERRRTAKTCGCVRGRDRQRTLNIVLEGVAKHTCAVAAIQSGLEGR